MVYIETGSTDVYYNFGCEYYFASEKKFEDTVFLFWRTEPTLMLGKYQNVAEEINLPYAKERGMHIVRRMSGGGTIYTDLGGWQFTFIDRLRENEIEFQRYIGPVIAALGSFGVEASFNGRNDLCIGSRKISGNAQYRLGDSMIHHGSLLFDTDIESMVRATSVDSYKIFSKSIKSVRERVCNIREMLPESAASLSALEFKEAMISAILSGSGKEERYALTEEDRERIETLAGEKFNNWESIYGKNPSFNIEKSGRFAGGKVVFRLKVVHGRIESASVFGDFFSTMDASELCGALRGVSFDRESVLRALREHGAEGAVYRISASELAGLIAD